jgi:hypothetical protein
MSNKSYHNCSENSSTAEDPKTSATQANQSEDHSSAKAKTKQSDLSATRFIQHHLPWDRHTKAINLRPRPSIVANNPDLGELASQTWGKLRSLNQPPFLFRRENKLCRVEADDNGHPVPVGMDSQRMNYTLVRLIDWKKRKKGGDVNVRPPRDLAPHLVADPDPPVPTLGRIVTAPIFTADGRLLQKPGDYGDGVLYLPPKSFRLPALADDPTVDELRSAVDFINDNLFVDSRLRANPIGQTALRL